MKISYDKGFTLIETLVAITILMIAIAGPLTVATKAYTASLDARNQTIAISLAQETMEYLNNIKDNAAKDGGSGFDAGGLLSECSGSNNYCDIIPDLNIGILTHGKCLDSFTGDPTGLCRLYEDESDGYNHFNGAPTPFRRYFYLTTTGLTPAQALATVIVSWNTGSTLNEIKLQEVLSNTIR